MERSSEIQTASRPRCDICGSEGIVSYKGVRDFDRNTPGEWSFRQCPNKDCRLLWLDPAPLASELWKAYLTYHTHSRPRVPWFEKQILSVTNRFSKLAFFLMWLVSGLWQEKRSVRFMTLNRLSTGKLLDVGCGGGRFLHRMKRLRWDVEGVDFDAKATLRVSERYGIKTHTGDFIGCRLPSHTYDAVTMSHTIEHLYEPEAVLRECIRIMRPGGRLVVITPNVNCLAAAEFGPYWRGLEPPRHINIFSLNGLERLLRQVGFGEMSSRSLSAEAAIIYRVSRQARNGSNNSLLMQVRIIVWSYWKELREFHMNRRKPDIGEDIIVVASKPL